MNHFSCIAKVCVDPEVRMVGSTKKVNLRLNVGERFKKDGEVVWKNVYFDGEVWDKGAEVIENHFKKGSWIVIEDASLKQDEWDDKESGKKRSKLYFRINKFSFLPKNSESNLEGGETKQSKKKETIGAGVDDDVPF